MNGEVYRQLQSPQRSESEPRARPQKRRRVPNATLNENGFTFLTALTPGAIVSEDQSEEVRRLKQRLADRDDKINHLEAELKKKDRKLGNQDTELKSLRSMLVVKWRGEETEE